MTDTAFQRAATYLDRQMVQPIRQQVIARKLLAKHTVLPQGKTRLTYNQITERGAATISFKLPNKIDRDATKRTPRTIDIPVNLAGYQIERQEFDAFKSEGIDLNADEMLSAAQVVADAEETMLMMGWKPDGSTEVIPGLYLMAGNTAGGADFGTYGNAIASVAAGMAACFADKVKGVNFHMVLNSVQYGELLGSVSTNGERELPQVVEQLNHLKGAPMGTVWQSDEIAAGTGLLVPVDPAGVYIDLVVGSDMKNTLGMDSTIPEISPIYGTVYEYVRPRAKHADGSGDTVALCSLTGI